jgi:hypothetical protein
MLSNLRRKRHSVGRVARQINQIHFPVTGALFPGPVNVCGATDVVAGALQSNPKATPDGPGGSQAVARLIEIA